MLPEILLLCSIVLVIAGAVLAKTSWASLTFQQNRENEYRFEDLAFYGGKLCALKNLFRGLIGIFTLKHQALRLPSLFLMTALLLLGIGCVLLLPLLK